MAEQYLMFDTFNFKLAVIQALMYELKLLEPFDIYEFAESRSGEGIDTESVAPIPQAEEYFRELAIPAELADKVTEIFMDGGNEIYMNIVPQWDGEDGAFELNSVTARELAQFPRLKKAVIMSGEYEKVSAVFAAAGIECGLL